MSPRDVAEALLRRWYVLLLGLLLTAAGAYPVLRPTPEFLSSAVVVLKPPVTGNQVRRLRISRRGVLISVEAFG